MSGSVGVDSEQRLRGHSLSAGHPVVTADLSYDDRSGIYVGASAVGVLSGDRPGLMSVQGNIGYAVRLGSSLSVDVGVLRTEYTSSFSGERAAHYSEAYVGLTRRNLVSRVYFSPDYFRTGISTLYGEVEASTEVLPHLQLNAHVGGLLYLNRPQLYVSRRDQYDWRLGASRQLGAFEAHLFLSSGGPGPDYYSREVRSRTALVLGVSRSF